MRTLSRVGFAILLLLALCPAPAAAQAQDWQQVPIPKLPELHPAQPKRFVLPNGMVVFLQEDHELPLVSGLMYIRGGSRNEPAAKTGLVALYGSTWRTGGTQAKTGDQLDTELESRAAHVETGGGFEAATVHFDCLKQDFDMVFADFVDVLEHPAFREDKLKLAQTRMAAGIIRRNDDIDSIAGREGEKLGYGANSAYARYPELYTMKAVTRQDLVAWHQKYVHPNNIIFGMVGDFDSAQIEQKIRQAFGPLPKGPEYKPTEAAIDPAKPGIYFAEKDDVNQSSVQLIELGIKRDNPDYFAIRCFNEIFGGGFSSRLFKSLRTKEGLAYSVGGGIGAAYNHPGVTDFEISTKSASTVDAINGLYREIDNLDKEPATTEELQRAKDSILNGFIFNFDSPDKVLAERMTYELYGYPADFLERFRSGVEKVTVDDVNRVAKKYIDRSKFKVLVVGRQEDFQKPLSSLGAVQTLDISIPQSAPGASPGATKASAGKE